MICTLEVIVLLLLLLFESTLLLLSRLLLLLLGAIKLPAPGVKEVTTVASAPTPEASTAATSPVDKTILADFCEIADIPVVPKKDFQII